MPSQYSDKDKARAKQTLESIEETINQLIEWNKGISSADDFYLSRSVMQLLAANCTLLTAIGEGVNRVNRIIPGFLSDNFPNIPWKAVVGMRNHIAHGYFEIDAGLIFEAVTCDVLELQPTISKAIELL